MKQVSPEELKLIQLQILNSVSEFCEKHNIRYFLDCGTLLGAIRHKGYIPWDDDVDIGMLRPDYDRFLKEFNQSNELYKVYSIENNSDFCSPHAKILASDTVLYEPDEKGRKLCINIDLFVYDNAPDDKKTLAKMFRARDFYRSFNIIRTLNNKPNGNFLRRFFIQFLRIVAKPFPKNYFCRKMVKNSKRFVNAATKRVGNFTSFSKMVCDRHVFDGFTTAEFEGKLYQVPQGYDEWLRAFYGDYMQLPPPEKRVSHHAYLAYIKSE